MNPFRIAGSTALAITAALALGGPVLAQTGAVNASTPQGMSTGPVSDQAAASAQGNTGEPSAPATDAMSPPPRTPGATATRHLSRRARPGARAAASSVGQAVGVSKTSGQDAGAPH